MSEEQVTPPTSATQPQSLLRAYQLNLDGPLLKEQRSQLNRMLDDPSVPTEYTSSLEGIRALLDELADQAWDNHGIDGLLLGGSDMMLAYMQRKQMPLEVVDDVLVAVLKVPFEAPVDHQLKTLLTLLGLAELRRRIDAAAEARATPAPVVEPQGNG